MNVKAVLFDLDGTLLDTLEDIIDTLNEVLEKHGYPTHSLDKGRFLVGKGMHELIRNSLPETADVENVGNTLLTELLEHYSFNWNRKSRPYPGIPAMLDDLDAKGMKKAILSNKADRFTQLCVSELLADWHFDEVTGHREGRAHKPDPSGALMIAEKLGCAPEEILYVGDSGIDMQTASRANMYPMGVLWGFRPERELLECGARTLVKSPEEISAFLRNQHDRP